MGSLTEANIGNLLEWTYDKILVGLPGTDSAIELANNYLSKTNNPQKALENLINTQVTKCATSGFLTGLGGLLTLPVAIPANIASVMYVQMRMIAAIAHIRGFDLKDDQVKTFVFVCLTGQSVAELSKQTGIKIGLKVGQSQIKRIPGSVLLKINQKVGFRLVTKLGEKGVFNLSKMVPLVGGVIGGGVDAISTKVIAKAAKKTFIIDVSDFTQKPIID